MLNTQHITDKLSVTPLIHMHDAAFAKRYCDGLLWSCFVDYKGDKAFSDAHLIANLNHDTARGYFDGQHEDALFYVGLYFGALHGYLLSPEHSANHPDVSALATFSHPDAAKGYNVGR